MIDFSKKILPNGLILIHHFDPTTPFVTVNTLYKVGAKDETKDKTGFAHLFEHLMFGGSKHFPDFDKPLQEAGGENNAFTNNDYTNYYDTVPAINVEVPFALEADRMRFLNINKKSLEVQRKVVCEEFKENYINQPYGNVWHLLRELVYEKHPYQWPTIGKTLKHIEDATLEDVQAFYNKYYQPNNAILVIAGNITEAETFALTRKYFGNITTKPLQHTIVSEPEQTTAKEKTVYEDVPLNAVFIAFKMCDRLHPDYYTADIISDILSNGISSRLHQSLVKDKKAFIEIDAYISSSNEVGMFVVEGKVAQDYDVQKATDLIWNELEKLHQTKVSDTELQKCKNKMLTYHHFSETNLLNRAISLAYFELLGDANMINNEEEKYFAVTASDIQNFALHYLTKNKSNTLFYLIKK